MWVDQDKTSRPEGLNATAQQKSIQKVSINRRKKEHDYYDALGNRKKVERDMSGEEVEDE